MRGPRKRQALTAFRGPGFTRESAYGPPVPASSAGQVSTMGEQLRLTELTESPGPQKSIGAVYFLGKPDSEGSEVGEGDPFK